MKSSVNVLIWIQIREMMEHRSVWFKHGLQCRRHRRQGFDPLVKEILWWKKCQFSSVQSFSHVQLFGSHGPQQAMPLCSSPAPRVYSNSCPSRWWCHPTISSSVVPFSSHLQSFPSSGSFQRSQFFALGDQSIGVSASTLVLSMNIQDWFPWEWTS